MSNSNPEIFQHLFMILQCNFSCCSISHKIGWPYLDALYYKVLLSVRDGMDMLFRAAEMLNI